MNRVCLFVLFAASALSPSRAGADSCVEIDTDRDTLSEQDRAGARSLFLQALESNGQTVSRGPGAPCTVTYRVSNVRLGNSVTSTVTGPEGTRTMSVRAVEDLPNAYDQMVRSLLSGSPISNTSSVLTRENVTANQAAPRRAEADSLWYARLGYGVTAGGAASGGPAFGFGYRHELDKVGIDLSFINLTYATYTKQTEWGAETEADVSGSWVRLLAYYYAAAKANSSLYAGAGLSWGGAAVWTKGTAYSGSGMQGEISLGYEVLRASTIRLFLQADATLPFYQSTADEWDTATPPAGKKYTPTFVVSLGGGFGRGHQVIRGHLIP